MAPVRGSVSRPSSRVLTLCLLLVAVVMETVMGFTVPEAPTARIVVHVRRRRAQHWDLWQINSNVCPPSLCRASSEGSSVPAPRPRGTGGSVFYQGDIVLDKEVDRYIYPDVNHTRYRRATVRLRNRLWKDGEVPYVFSGTLSAQARNVILRAFKHISQRTCITFRQRKGSDSDFIKFISEPGCWSAIGRTGGRQLLSLGRGCENVGTAVHEITHSLGVWHEQSRKDRDKYVRIIEDNISERFLKDFEKVDSRVSTSRGYPYDYRSVMHYSRYAFTRNGKPTIEVIGIGKELGLTVKQRSGLSTIDMAQLRDMYRCNLHTDTNQTICPKNWVKHETSCYKFFQHPKKQFAAASKQCKELNSHLLFIESQREDEFLARHLLKAFPYVYNWRTGGRRINGTMKWYREGSTPLEMEHSNWGRDQPSTFTTMALQRDRRNNETRWVGVWAGSMSQLPHFAYPFICERRAKRKCLKLRHKNGRDYRGKLDHTIDGYTCQRWSDQYPHQHNLTDPSTTGSDAKEDADGLGHHNFCRNPKKQRRSRPWCYTTKKTHEWQLCDVTACSTSGSGSGSSSRRPSRPTQATKKPTSSSDNSGGHRPSSGNSGDRRQATDVLSSRDRELTAADGGIVQVSTPARGRGRRWRRRRRHLERKRKGGKEGNSKRRRRRRHRKNRKVAVNP